MRRAVIVVLALFLAGCLDDSPTRPRVVCDTLTNRDAVLTCEARR